MVGAVGIEPTTFGLKVRFRATRQHTPYNKDQWNQYRTAIRVGPIRLLLYPVHEQLHGQFRRSHGCLAFFRRRRAVRLATPKTPAINMHKAHPRANARIISSGTWLEVKIAATPKSVPTTTKKTTLLLRYCQAVTRRNAMISASPFLIARKGIAFVGR